MQLGIDLADFSGWIERYRGFDVEDVGVAIRLNRILALLYRILCFAAN